MWKLALPFGVGPESSVMLSVKLHTGRQKMAVSFKYPIGVQLSPYTSFLRSMRKYTIVFKHDGFNDAPNLLDTV